MFSLSKTYYFHLSLFCVFVFSVFFVFPASAGLYDQEESNKQLGAFVGKQGADLGEVEDPRSITALIIKSFLSLLGIATIFYMIYGGYLILTSAGEEDKIKKGRTIIVEAAIAIFIILSAYGITLLVAQLLQGQTKQGCVGPDPNIDYGKDSFFKNSFWNEIDCPPEGGGVIEIEGVDLQ